MKATMRAGFGNFRAACPAVSQIGVERVAPGATGGRLCEGCRMSLIVTTIW